MSFNKISIGNLPSIHSDLIVMDSINSELIYVSLVGYSNLLQSCVKELKTSSLHCYISKRGSCRTSKLGYNHEIRKDTASDYAHLIAYCKDKITYKDDGTEEIQIFLYCKDELELEQKIFEKINKHSSVPVLFEWKSYLLKELKNEYKIRELSVISSNENIPFKVYRAFFNKNNIKNIVIKGLQDKEINIKGHNNPSIILNNINGLNDYLNCFGEHLAEKIQKSFVPKFIPGKDKYDKYANYVDDFIYNEANIELFEAQKTLIQATVNNLKINKSTFVVSEMGSGKSLMGACIPFVHNSNINKGFNCVVMCPSHLTIKWKREIEERIPNSKGYIVNDFKELINIENKLRNKNKVENSYIILSKERAKMSYDNRPAAIWSKSKNTFVCPDCGQALYTIEHEGSGRRKRKIKVNFNKLSMTKEYAFNKRCMNEKAIWNNKEQKYDLVPCNARLWGPLNRDDQNHKWFKLGSEGWVYKEHIQEITDNLLSQEKLSKKENSLFKKILEPYNEIMAGKEPTVTYKGQKKYAIAKYIKDRMNDLFDYCIVDLFCD